MGYCRLELRGTGTFPGSCSTFARRNGDRFLGRVAQAEENLLRSVGVVGIQTGDRLLQFPYAIIVRLAGSLGAVEEGGYVDQLASGVHKAEFDEIDLFLVLGIIHSKSNGKTCVYSLSGASLLRAALLF